jgi:hypothetical protein
LLAWVVTALPEAYEVTRLMDARRPDQVAADAAEAQASVRYLRQRTFAGVLDDAIARAQAIWRLEAALQQGGGEG